MTLDNALIQERVALMVQLLALEAVRGGTLKDSASPLPQCTLFMVLTFNVQNIVPLSHVFIGGSTIPLLKETGSRKTDKEAVSVGEKVWVLESARPGYKSLTSGRKLTFPEHQFCASPGLVLSDKFYEWGNRGLERLISNFQVVRF